MSSRKNRKRDRWADVWGENPGGENSVTAVIADYSPRPATIEKALQRAAKRAKVRLPRYAWKGGTGFSWRCARGRRVMKEFRESSPVLYFKLLALMAQGKLGGE